MTAVRVRRWATVAVVGQSIFPLAWLVAGGLERGYSHERQYVSELAARNAGHAWIADIGIAALGISFFGLGMALSAALPKRSWSGLPAALFIALGVGMLLVILFPLDCSPTVDPVCKSRLEDWGLSWRHYAHEFVSLVLQLMIAATPFALALALRRGPLARIALALGLIGLVLGAGQFVATAADGDRTGIYQRAGLIVMQGWAYLIAAGLLVSSALPLGSEAPTNGAQVARDPGDRGQWSASR
jgi:hypothetical protein